MNKTGISAAIKRVIKIYLGIQGGKDERMAALEAKVEEIEKLVGTLLAIRSLPDERGEEKQ